MADGVLVWWTFLCVAAALNVVAWGVAAVILANRQPLMRPDIHTTRRWLLWLSAVYVLGCGFRSILPMIDAPRICLLDTWFWYVIVGRSVATVAELCFIAQCALLMREAGRNAGSGFAILVSRSVIPIIVVAEMCCWYAVLSTNYFAHAAENSLWTAAAVLSMAAFVSLWPHAGGVSRHFLAVAIACGIAYIAFMAIVDVPMYVSRWQADVASGRDYLPLRVGLAQIMQRCIVTLTWEAWREDVPWMTLYFTVAVWSSIALVHASPLAARTPAPGNRNR